MSRDDDNVVEAPGQPREWFAVLFGTRCLRGEKEYIRLYTNALKNICLEEGVALTANPSRSLIFEDDNVDELLDCLGDSIRVVHEKHKEGFHMPLVLVIDDQTLHKLHEDYLDPHFNTTAWLYTLKAPLIKEFCTIDKWTQVRADIRDLGPIMQEDNPLPPLPVVERPPPPPPPAVRQRASHPPPLEEPRRRYSSPQDEHHPPADRYHDDYRGQRDRDEEEEEELDREVREITMPQKLFMTPEVVEGALRTVDENPQLLAGLAEDMDANINFAVIQEFPWPPSDLLNLLELFVRSTENTRSAQTADDREASKRLRKRITERMLTSGLLKEVYNEFVRTLHERVDAGEITNSRMLQCGNAIILLLRAFVQLGKHTIFDDDSLALWGLLESPVFGLPGRFWHAIAEPDAETMCQLAAKVTSNDPSLYQGFVCKALLEEQRRQSASTTHRSHHNPETERRRRADDLDTRAGPSSRAYKYDPYGVDDEGSACESDTSEKYATGEDGFDARLVQQRNGARTTNGRAAAAEREQEEESREQKEAREEQRRRRIEEEKREEEEQQRAYEEEARKAREYELRAHNLALQKLERQKWEESNDICIAWAENDGTEPATSYRTLANVPVYSDLYKPKAPFIRRALLNGAYTDNEHYLDVQYRLMREDMVSPLRDGIYGQKILTDPNQLIASSNDLKIYPTIQIGALQVRSMDGLPMRLVQIPSHMLMSIREERQLKFGQCVVLSSDKFDREFHVGWICDRYQEPGLPWQGRLAISFFDEIDFADGAGRPIDRRATYAVAESPAYLEAYRHVLRVIKKIKKNAPFPLERYLVHMKKNTRLPQYMRAKEKDEDKEEDKQRQLMYSKKAVEAARKKQEEREKKQKRGRATPGSSGEDPDEEADVTTEEGVSEENLADDGFNTDEEDQFLTGRRALHPNPKDLETISIAGRSYNVDKLAEEYESDTLDETQRKALCYALTSELAIIQGPPGTGKTHIGVDIVMAILENRTKWRMTEPVLIVTFSNQALDHFLDKIRQKIEEKGLGSPDAPSVVRLGSRSEHEGIKLNCLLSTVMKDYEEDLAGEANNERIKTRKHKQGSMLKLMRAVKTVQLSRSSIMQYNTLRSVMLPDHDMQLRQAQYGLKDSSGNPMNSDEMLVSWLLNKSYEKRRDMPPGSDDDDQEEEWGGGVAYHAVKPDVQPQQQQKKRGEGGRETKKEKNERKRMEKRGGGNGRKAESAGEESDDESDGPTEMNIVDEDNGANRFDGLMTEEEEIAAEAMLKAALERMTKKVKAMHVGESWQSGEFEKYEMQADWECEREYEAKMGRMLVDDVEIFSRTTKPAGTRTVRGDNKQVNVDPRIVRDISEQKEYILTKEALTKEEVDTIRDLRTLPKEQRWRLLMYWQTKLAEDERRSLDELCRRHMHACTVAENAADVSRAAVLRRALIVGATTTGSAKRRALVARIAPRVLVVEEAAEVLEAHLLASIVPSCQHAIFIGDHQQLRPSTAVHTLAKMANMEVSLFERLVKNGYPYQTLGLQHRMLAPLTEHVVKPWFYKMLQDAPSIHEYPNVAGMHTNLFFWAHNVAEDTVRDSMSKKNIVEAEMCRNLANYIVMQGQYKPKEITIIGMYGAQVTEIRDLLRRVGGSLSDVAVETVDSFQGKENRVMILSLVRSNSGSVGFLAIANRITVALTRAQHGMYVVGNFEDIASYSEMWHNIVGSLNNANLIDYSLPVVCQRHGNKTGIRVNADFVSFTPHGGCDQRCGYEMQCGHACKQVCHPPHQHEQYCSEGPDLECREPCDKTCPKCANPCTKKCRDACGQCHAIVTLELDCGHTVRCECGARNLARCKEPCAEELECGHLCQNKCSVDCVPVSKCDKGVAYRHPVCKHALSLPCNVIRNTIGVPPCYEKCPEKLVCGHKCPLNCGQPCPTMCETTVTFTATCGHQLQKKCSEDARHVKCTAIVDSDMPHCSHRIKIECYQSKNQNECRSSCKKPTSCGHECTLSCGECYKRASAHECSAPCRKDLPCGHRCQGSCGKPCVCLNGCRVRCSHQRCGHISKDKGGNFTFGRNCSQPCVLCVESCDNRCEHRSCNKKCFEVCDVNSCSEPCSAMLKKCGHACLGLCGEPCPRLCGMCETTAYRTLIAQYPPDEKEEVPRLIQLPECEHIFPYKYMDKRVREQLAAGNIVLRCPRCNGMIDDCKRYLKVTKRFWAEADARKWERKLHEEDWSRAEVVNKYSSLQSQLTSSRDLIANYQKVIVKSSAVKDDKRFAFEAFRELESLYNAIRAELVRTTAGTEYYYWKAVCAAYKNAAGLVMEYLWNVDLCRIDFVADNQPNLKAVMDEAFDRKRSRIYPIRDQFRAMLDVVRSSMQYRRVGQLVPLYRIASIKAHLHYHMEHLNASMRGRQDPENGSIIDLTVTQAATYKRVIRSILKDPPHDHPAKKLEQMMAKIHADVYGKWLPTEALPKNIFRVELPDF